MKDNIIKQFSLDLQSNRDKTFKVEYNIFEFLKSMGRFEFDGLIELENDYSGYFVNKNNLIFNKQSLKDDVNKYIEYVNENQNYFGHTGELKYVDKVFYDIKIDNLILSIEDLSKFFIWRESHNLPYNECTTYKSFIDDYYVIKNLCFKKDRVFEYIDIAIKKRGIKSGSIITPIVSGKAEDQPSIGKILYIFGYPKDIYGRVFYNDYTFLDDYYYCEKLLNDEEDITINNLDILFDKLYKNKRFSDYNNHSDWDVTYSLSECRGIIERRSVITDRRERYNTTKLCRIIGNTLLDEEKDALK